MFLLGFLEPVSDWIEDRYGRLAAALFALFSMLAALGIMVGVLILVLTR